MTELMIIVRRELLERVRAKRGGDP